MIFPTLENVNMALSKIKEVAQSHNGELLLIEVLIINSEKFDVIIKLNGACSLCAISEFTIRYGVEKTLKEIYFNFRQVILQD